MKIKLGRVTLHTGMLFSEFQNEFQNAFHLSNPYEVNETTIATAFINTYYEQDGKKYRGYAEMYFSRLPNGDGVLDRIRGSYNEIRYNITMIPRRRDQDTRYYGHKELLESLLGKPTEETNEYVKYQRDGGYIICRQFLSGPKMYSGGYIEMFFNH